MLESACEYLLKTIASGAVLSRTIATRLVKISSIRYNDANQTSKQEVLSNYGPFLLALQMPDQQAIKVIGGESDAHHAVQI